MRQAVEIKRKPCPTHAEVRGLLVDLLQEICGIAEERITDHATIDRELEMESVELVQLQVAIEQELDITIDFLEVLRLNSFGRIVGYLHREAELAWQGA